MTPAMHTKPWSPEDDQMILAMIQSGRKALDIAPCFPERTTCSVEARYARIRKANGLHQIRGKGEPVPGGYRQRMDTEHLAAQAAAYEKARRLEAERGCRKLKEAMDSYYERRALGLAA